MYRNKNARARFWHDQAAVLQILESDWGNCSDQNWSGFVSMAQKSNCLLKWCCCNFKFPFYIILKIIQLENLLHYLKHWLKFLGMLICFLLWYCCRTAVQEWIHADCFDLTIHFEIKIYLICIWILMALFYPLADHVAIASLFKV